jgi:death-on-curing protein
MKYLSVEEVLRLHEKIIENVGGEARLSDRARLEASVHQIRQTAEGEDLYSGLEEKAAALCYFLVMNHPFTDGNKRIGHAAMELFLRMNGKEISAEVDEQEHLMFDLAAGKIEREEFTEWVREHVTDVRE